MREGCAPALLDENCSGEVAIALIVDATCLLFLSLSLQIEQCQKGVRQGRLYVTDGSMPDYEAQQYPQDAPGRWLIAF